MSSKAEKTFGQLREEKKKARQELQKAEEKELRFRTIFHFHQENLDEYFFFLNEKLQEECGGEYRLEDVEIKGHEFNHLNLYFNFTLDDLEGVGRFDFKHEIMEPFFEEFNSKDDWVKVFSNTGRMERGEYNVNVQFDR